MRVGVIPRRGAERAAGEVAGEARVVAVARGSEYFPGLDALINYIKFSKGEDIEYLKNRMYLKDEAVRRNLEVAGTLLKIERCLNKPWDKSVGYIVEFKGGLINSVTAVRASQMQREGVGEVKLYTLEVYPVNSAIASLCEDFLS